MQSNNNVSPEAMIVLGALAIAIFIIKIVVIIACSVAILLASYLTVISLFALKNPITIDGQTITPQEARTFLSGGVMGAIGTFAVLAVGSELGLNLSGDIIPYSLPLGYILGSFGSLYDLEQETEKARKNAENAATQQILPPPSFPERPYDPPPFFYADWDDEEKR